MINWLAVILALFLGVIVGYFLAALMVAAKRGDEEGDRQRDIAIARDVAIGRPKCPPSTTLHGKALRMFQDGRLSGYDCADIIAGTASPDLVRRVSEWRS